MKLLSMYKTVSFVLFLVIGANIHAEDKPTGGGNITLGGKSAGELEQERRQQCTNLLSKKSEAETQFRVYCKEEEKKVEDCAKRLKECSSVGEEEQSFANLTTMMGMPAIPDLAEESEGACSKYTTDKLESAIKDAKSTLDRKEEKELEAARKQQEADERDAEALQKKNEEFIKQQEEKVAEDLKSKEDLRNNQASYEKQQQEYKARMRTLSDEIFAIQKAQQILNKKRALDIANYKGMMLAAQMKCTADVKKAIASIDPNAGRAGNLGRAQQKAKEARDLYASCMDQETTKRVSDAEQFKVDMEKFDRQLQNKAAELEEVNKSSQSLTKMFNEAAIDNANKRTKDEENFAKKQSAKWMEIYQFGQNITNKKNTNIQALAKAKASTMEASNELMSLKKQKPVGNKSSEDIRRDYLAPYVAAKDAYEKSCSDSAQKSSSSSSSASAPAGGGAH